MNIEVVINNGKKMAIVNSNEVLISDVQSALDLIATIRYEADCDYFVMNKQVISEDFFKLSTKLAGDILQKFINYQVKVAIVGDFSVYSSKSLKDFIYESNKGKNVFFLGSNEEALEKLGKI
ncbi:DUF4180 domain-containing protein [Caldalkalibacillus mannanilyticus]|uniref:DUF4180 domain-containing protein n=1 Tax=Caldalkalibacillus mannanilyticus TaxID=1418 RepID=UPI00046963A5|nr:DUF4180 domain-containing protein [Caldalkalibacillus mannanilyticus]